MRTGCVIIALVFLGLGAALAAFVLGGAWMATRVRQTDDNAIPEMATMLVAARDLEASSALRAEDIANKTVKMSELPPGSYSVPSEIIGKILATRFQEDEMFKSRSFLREGSGAYLAGTLSPGYRAVNIELDEAAGLEGLLYPGSVVDVLASFSLSSKAREGKAVSITLLENIQVLAVENVTASEGAAEPLSGEADTATEPARPKRPSSSFLVTLLVDTEQAKSLMLAYGHGEISLTLRSPKDDRTVEKEGTVLSDGELLARSTFDLMAQAQEDEGEEDVPEQEVPDQEVTETSEPVEPSEPPVKVIEIIRGSERETKSFPSSGS